MCLKILIPNTLLLTNHVFVLAGSSRKALSPATPSHLLPVLWVLQTWAWNHSQRQPVSFWVEKICFCGSLGKAGYHITTGTQTAQPIQQNRVWDLYPMREPEHRQLHTCYSNILLSQSLQGSFPGPQAYSRSISCISMSLALKFQPNWSILPLSVNKLENALLVFP